MNTRSNYSEKKSKGGDANSYIPSLCLPLPHTKLS